MKRRVFVNEREVPLDAGQAPVRAATVREVEPGVYSVLWNGRSFAARISAQAEGYAVDINGFRLMTQVRDPRNSATRLQASLGAVRQNITASMPGKVIRVLVAEEQEIEPGQGLIVIEAMKMQNEMKASKPGRVAQVRTKDGDTVAAGDVLITIE
jgi:biotin carboxyl carrier protein